VAERGQELKVHGIKWIGTLIRQICADYNSLPDVRAMTIGEIKFFYEPLIPGLAKQQREK